MSDASSALEGVWQMIRAELNGEPAPETVTSNTVLELNAGTYTVRYAGEVKDRGTFAHDTSDGIRRIILRGEEGPNAGRTIPCIYQLAGDRLRVCFGLDGEQPFEFAAPISQKRYLAMYRRLPWQAIRQYRTIQFTTPP